MKRLFYYPAIILLLMTTACEDALDLNNPNTIPTDQFWKTDADAKLGVNAAYGNFYRVGSYRRMLYFNYDARSDEGTSTSPAVNLRNWMKFQILNYNLQWGMVSWHDQYEGIYRTNQVIANVPAIDMDETLKNQYLGEAKFLRALNYFNLTSLWGNVAMQLMPSTTTDLPAYATQQQVWAQIEKDLTEAIPGLPASYPDAEKGRATKGAAYALLAKTYMQQHKYSEAKTALEWLVEGEGKQYYGLVADYKDNFTHLNENNIESVFEVQYSDENVGGDAVDGPGASVGNERAQFFAPRGTGWSDAQATRFVVNELSQEKTVTGERDPRLPVTALYSHTDERGPTFTMVYGKTFAERFGAKNQEVWFHKYQNDYHRDFEDYHSPINIRVIRFADVLLLYAECLNELGQTPGAYPYVDRVRQRVGLAPLSLVKPGMGKAQFLEQLKHERVCELAGESTRWNDLVRWGYLDDAAKVAELAQHDSDFNKFEVGKHKFLPIPQSELDLNPNLVQNDNW
jgi:starch-binding outer membrane protein, SusD/RagB family